MALRMLATLAGKPDAALATLLLVAATGFVSTCEADCAAVDPLRLLPEGESCPGWSLDGDPATARTLEELQLVIDGGAPLFFQHGFVSGAFQDYAGTVAGSPARMQLSIYNQGSPQNAEALFHDENSGSGDPLPDWSGSGAARYRIAFGLVSLQFWERCCFAIVLVHSGGEDALPHARCAAEEVVRLLDQATPTDHRSWGEVKAVFR